MNTQAAERVDVIDAEMPQALPLATQPIREIQAAQSTPDNLLAMAMQNGASIEMMERLLALKERHDANEATKALDKAMAGFKSESVVIRRDKENKQYGSTYVSLGNLVGTVTPFLSKHGLSASWDQTQDPETNKITVICKLSHAMGASRSTSFTVPPDTAGAKNPIQQIKSAITYAKAVTFESVCGLASTDANMDDDGNSTGVDAVKGVAAEDIAAKMLADFRAQLRACTADQAAAALWATAGKALLATGDKKTYTGFRDEVVAHRTALRDGGARNV